MRDRHGALVAVTSTLEPRPRVLALTQYSDTLWVADGNSTEGGVITAAGGLRIHEWKTKEFDGRECVDALWATALPGP